MPSKRSAPKNQALAVPIEVAQGRAISYQRVSTQGQAADAANAAVVAAHLVAAITSFERGTAHDRGDVVFGVPKPPSNGLSADHWALITALTPPRRCGESDQRSSTSHPDGRSLVMDPLVFPIAGLVLVVAQIIYGETPQHSN